MIIRMPPGLKVIGPRRAWSLLATLLGNLAEERPEAQALQISGPGSGDLWRNLEFHANRNGEERRWARSGEDGQIVMTAEAS